MNAKTPARLLLASVLAASAVAYAVEQPIQVAVGPSQSAVQFKIGDSRCVLIDDQIVCTRVVSK